MELSTGNMIIQKRNLDARELLMLESEVKNRGKSMLVAYVLWYFLGLFGAHRFYMYRIATAVVMLVLSLTIFGMVVTFIWWVIDAFLLHGWVKDRNRQLEAELIQEIIAMRPRPPEGAL